MKTLKSASLSLALALALAAPAHAGADAATAAIEERLEQMERRLLQLERKVMEQERMLAEKDHEIARLSDAPAADDGWWRNVSLSGLLEVEAKHVDPDGGDSTSDVRQKTVELGLAADVTSWTSAEVVLLYEDEGQESTSFDVDSATLTFARPGGPWHVTAGLQFLPFGTYATHMISDPLTQELGEIRETAAAFGTQFGGGFHGSVFTFNGDNETDDDDRIQEFGASVGYASDFLSVDLAYLNNIKETNLLTGTGVKFNDEGEKVDPMLASGAGRMADTTGRESGYAVSLAWARGNLSLFGEYMAASSELYSCSGSTLVMEGGNMYPVSACHEPEAWTLEAGWTFNLGRREATVAFGMQETEDLDFAELPSERWLLGFSTEMAPGVGLKLEWASEEDYASSDTDTFKMLLATEF